MQVSEQSQIIL